MVRDAREVFLDRLEGGGQVRGCGEVGCRAGVDGDREEGGEPADGPGEFGFEAGGRRDEPGFAAVALEFDVREGLVLAEVAAPPGEGDGERRHQDVVDARVEHRGCPAEQRGRGAGVDRHGADALARHGVALGQGPSAQRVGPAPAGGAGSRCCPRRTRRAPAVGSSAGTTSPPGGVRRGLPAVYCRHAVARSSIRTRQDTPSITTWWTTTTSWRAARRQTARSIAPPVRVQFLGGEGDARVERLVALLPAGGAATLGSASGMSKLQRSPRTSLARSMACRWTRAARIASRASAVRVRGGVEHDGLDEAVDRVGGLAEPLHDG
ncbi:hypothetical protein STENM223S_05506 [Streptomyces tendae]